MPIWMSLFFDATKNHVFFLGGWSVSLRVLFIYKTDVFYTYRTHEIKKKNKYNVNETKHLQLFGAQLYFVQFEFIAVAGE